MDYDLFVRRILIFETVATWEILGALSNHPKGRREAHPPEIIIAK